ALDHTARGGRPGRCRVSLARVRPPQRRRLEPPGPKAAPRPARLGLGGSVGAAAELDIIDRPSRSNHRLAQIGRSGQAPSNSPAIGITVAHLTAHRPPADQGDELVARDVAAAIGFALVVLADLPAFRRIDTPKADPLGADAEGVAIDDSGRA